MERKDATRSWRGIPEIPEERLDTGALVDEGQRQDGHAETVGNDSAYLPDWLSTPPRVVPSGFASITPTAFLFQQRARSPPHRPRHREFADGDPAGIEPGS